MKLFEQKTILIGLSGHAGAGKDTIADWLVRDHGFVKLAFAAPLKDATARLFGWPREKLDDPIFKEEIDPFWKLSPRTVLQKLGTDCIRTEFGQDFWIRCMEQKIGQHPRVVITDVRFPNEVAMIKQWQGQAWRITRPLQVVANANARHPSETALDDFHEWDQLISNDQDLAALYERVCSIISQ